MNRPVNMPPVPQKLAEPEWFERFEVHGVIEFLRDEELKRFVVRQVNNWIGIPILPESVEARIFDLTYDLIVNALEGVIDNAYQEGD